MIDLRELVGFAGNGGEEVFACKPRHKALARRGLCTKEEERERVCVMRWIARCNLFLYLYNNSN